MNNPKKILPAPLGRVQSTIPGSVGGPILDPTTCKHRGVMRIYGNGRKRCMSCRTILRHDGTEV